jgi:hypothetical protein
LISFALLTIALKSLELSPAYAAWTGLGAAGTAAIGMLVMGEPSPPPLAAMPPSSPGDLGRRGPALDAQRDGGPPYDADENS